MKVGNKLILTLWVWKKLILLDYCQKEQLKKWNLSTYNGSFQQTFDFSKWPLFSTSGKNLDQVSIVNSRVMQQYSKRSWKHDFSSFINWQSLIHRYQALYQLCQLCFIIVWTIEVSFTTYKNVKPNRNDVIFQNQIFFSLFLGKYCYSKWIASQLYVKRNYINMTSHVW